ncbi:hypothetical protein T492DRAFT_1065793 [Pavlovales sp. CCMP2436]|nr:hypothetical protein T492DRAFT_1065793 [Pavlovales sp. CCMP2436]
MAGRGGSLGTANAATAFIAMQSSALAKLVASDVPPLPPAYPLVLRTDAGEEDDDEAIREHELRGAIQGLTAWKTQRHKELDRELADLEARYAGAVRALREKLAREFVEAHGLHEHRINDLKLEHKAQQKPVTEGWELGPLLARQADETTELHSELAVELRKLQVMHDTAIQQLSHARARDERRQQKSREAVDGVIDGLQTMRDQLASALDRMGTAESAAVGWHSQSEVQQRTVERLQLALHEHAQRDSIAAAEHAARVADAEREISFQRVRRTAAEEAAAFDRIERERMEAEAEAAASKPNRRLISPFGSWTTQERHAPRSAPPRTMASRKALFTSKQNDDQLTDGASSPRDNKENGVGKVVRRFPTLPGSVRGKNQSPAQPTDSGHV